MRAILTAGGIHIMVSNNEFLFVERFSTNNAVYKNILNIQDAEVARILTNKGVLKRRKHANNGIFYILNKNKGIK